MCARMLTSSPSVDKFLSLKRDPLTLTVLHSVYLQKSSGDFNFGRKKCPKFKPSEIFSCPKFLQHALVPPMILDFWSKLFEDNEMQKVQKNLCLTLFLSVYL